ncbi:hypothetical protein FHG87_007444 [Trinorchestia longiramus]|nr:hypothetical protein FHG87_007444 [Trinorchestia longiramus]
MQCLLYSTCRGHKGRTCLRLDAPCSREHCIVEKGRVAVLHDAAHSRIQALKHPPFTGCSTVSSPYLVAHKFCDLNQTSL